MRFFKSIYFKIILSLVALAVIYIELFVNPNKDLDIFIGASQLIFEGKTCYDVWLPSGSSTLKYYYSPLFGVLMFPLKDLPQLAYVFIWLLLNLFLTARIVKLLPQFLEIKSLSPLQQQWFWILLFITTVRSYYDTLGLGQMTIFLVWGSLECAQQLKGGRTMIAALILALIINFKLIPLALFGYFFYKGKWRLVIYTVLFSVLFLFLPALVIGYDFNNLLLSKWLGSLAETGGNSLTDDYGRQSLSAYVPALLMETPLQFETKRNILNLNPKSVELILNAMRLILVVLLAVLFGRPFSRTCSRQVVFYHVALVCLVTPLFFPHQGKYSFFYLAPAQAYAMYYFVSNYKQRHNEKKYLPALVLSALSFALLTLTTDGLIGRKASDWCEYFNFITYGAFLLIAVLVILKPDTSAENSK